MAPDLFELPTVRLYKQKGSSIWHVYARIKGKTQRKTTGERNFDAALEAAKKLVEVWGEEWKPRKERKPPDRNCRRPFRPDQLSRLLDVAPAERAVVYAVAASTKLHRKDLKALRWGEVWLSLECLIFRRGKGAYERHDLHSCAIKALKAHRPRRAVFPWGKVFVRGGKSGVPKSKTFKKDLKAAGLPLRLTFDSLRLTKLHWEDEV